jgi:hypothetical protein
MSKNRIDVRAKGHNLEREIVRMFKEELDMKFAKTSRFASKILDDCKVDIAGVPFLVQTKAGYSKNRPKADQIFKEIEESLLINFPPSDPIHTYPKVLIHKINGRNKYHNLVTMPYDDFKYLLKKIKNEL